MTGEPGKDGLTPDALVTGRLLRIPMTSSHIPASFGPPIVVNDDLLIRVSSDGLTACMEVSSALSGAASRLSADHVFDALNRAGIIHGIDKEEISRIIEELNEAASTASRSRDANDSPVIHGIASGEAATEGIDGTLKWHIDAGLSPTSVVLPGELIVTRFPAIRGHPGKDVYGHSIEPAQPREQVLASGPGIDIRHAVHDGRSCDEYRAAWLGTLRHENGVLEVDPRIYVNADATEAHMDLFARSSSGVAVGCGLVISTLESCGVVHGIDEDAIRKGLREALADPSGCIKQRLIARGTPPGDGRDARLSLKYNEQASGEELPDGRIDFHERRYPWNVSQGQVVGYHLEARAGAPGISVLGGAIEAPSPAPLDLKLDGLHRDSSGKLIADGDGALIIDGSHLSIVELLVIDGNVAQETGNIHSAVPVHVMGHVTPGFILESTKDLIIEKNVEDAIVRAGASVVIKGGIRGRHSEIYAPGAVHAGFVENASIFANGDIAVKGGVINSELASNGAITVSDDHAGHSAVIGGSMTAGLLVDVTILGAQSYAKTLIRVGIAQETRRRINGMENELNIKLNEIVRLAQIENHHRKHPAADSQSVLRKAGVTREALLAEITAIREQQTELIRMLAMTSSAKVMVRKKAYPGVIINISEHHYEVMRELGPGIFTLHDNSVSFRPR